MASTTATALLDSDSMSYLSTPEYLMGTLLTVQTDGDGRGQRSSLQPPQIRWLP
jgi:hypothetical protein